MVKLACTGLTLIMTLLILVGYGYSLRQNISEPLVRTKKFLALVLGLLFWFVYLSVLSHFKILQDFSLPPKLPLLVAAPLLVFTVLFYKKNKANPVIQNMPKTWPVYYQTFRIFVEIILLYTFFEGIVPKTATFEGLNFDVLIGFSAPFVGYFIFNKKTLNTTLSKAWNILGILMVLFVAFIITSSFYFPNIWGSKEILVSLDFLTMPYLLIAGFLAPSAIFMHIVSLTQLTGQKK